MILKDSKLPQRKDLFLSELFFLHLKTHDLIK